MKLDSKGITATVEMFDSAGLDLSKDSALRQQEPLLQKLNNTMSENPFDLSRIVTPKDNPNSTLRSFIKSQQQARTKRYPLKTTHQPGYLSP